MNGKFCFTISISLLFFLSLVIVGTNISAKQLAEITNCEVSPPFMFATTEDNIIRLGVFGETYQYSIDSIQNNYTSIKSSIQNFRVTVKFNIAPRVEYLRYQWDTGTDKLVDDISLLLKQLQIICSHR
ncbi:MAG: hypothetical protein ACOYJ1_00200 [Peptococcales bacterium]